MPYTRSAEPSAYNTITSNRSVGYEMGTALADIVDNSISAKATEITITTLPKPFFISICDNGTGMNQLGLDNAMTFGGKKDNLVRDPDDLGRFGLGLKTASLSQCKQLTVITKKNGVVLGGRWDMDYLKEHNEWNYLVVDESECLDEIKDSPLASYASGTLVIWRNFDTLENSSSNPSMAFTREADQAKKHLALVFHRYLSGKEEGVQKISISWNGDSLTPTDPFLTGKVSNFSSPISVYFHDIPIVVTPHKLPYPTKAAKLSDGKLEKLALGRTLLETQGFYVYRNKRLIIWGTWFRLAPKLDRTKLLRIQVDIPSSLDEYWSLDIKKSMAMPPDEIRERLKVILDTHKELSVQTFKPHVTHKAKDTIMYWNRIQPPEGQVRYEINKDHPLVKALLDMVPNEKRPLVQSLLNDLGTFLPVRSLQADLQSDVALENEEHATNCKEDEILGKIDIYFRQLHLSFDEIAKMDPISAHPEYLEIFKEKLKHV